MAIRHMGLRILIHLCLAEKFSGIVCPDLNFTFFQILAFSWKGIEARLISGWT
jgi:hypothetical protein